MTGYKPTDEELKSAKEVFNERLTAETLLDGERPQGAISASRLLAYARGLVTGDGEIDTALKANANLRKAFRQMIRDAALFALPEAMAASSDELPSRETQGCKLSLKPSRAEENQLYLIVETSDFTRGSPTVLVVCGREDETSRIDLPPPRNGVMQVILERESDIVKLLIDPKSEAFLS